MTVQTASLGSGVVRVAASGSTTMSQLLKRQPFTFDWLITDASGVGVNGCVVTATLYAGRSADNPDATPGLPVPSFSNKLLQGTVAGVYEGEIDNFDPPPGANYTMVVHARRFVKNGARCRRQRCSTDLMLSCCFSRYSAIKSSIRSSILTLVSGRSLLAEGTCLESGGADRMESLEIPTGLILRLRWTGHTLAGSRHFTTRLLDSVPLQQ